MVASQPSRPSDAEVLDAVVIGGGPAGLSAALVLGRCLRRVLVCDAGHPRNEPARIFNGFLSRDGSSPAEFLQICRDQLRRYETIDIDGARVLFDESRRNKTLAKPGKVSVSDATPLPNQFR